MSLTITADFLQRFVGGQLEYENTMGHYRFRGEIERVWIEGSKNATMYVLLKWLAEMGEDSRWHGAVDTLDYSVGLAETSFSEADDSTVHYVSTLIQEKGTFFPPEGSRLDPLEVEGLQLPS